MKIDELVEVAKLLKSEIIEVSSNNVEAANSLSQILPYIEIAISVKTSEEFSPQRLRFDPLFIDGQFANNTKLSELYAKFANLFEGLEV